MKSGKKSCCCIMKLYKNNDWQQMPTTNSTYSIKLFALAHLPNSIGKLFSNVSVCVFVDSHAYYILFSWPIQKENSNDLLINRIAGYLSTIKLSLCYCVVRHFLCDTFNVIPMGRW